MGSKKLKIDDLPVGKRLLAISHYDKEKNTIYVYPPAKVIEQSKLERSVRGPWDTIIELGNKTILSGDGDTAKAVIAHGCKNAIYVFDQNKIVTEEGIGDVDDFAQHMETMRIVVISWDEELEKVSEMFSSGETPTTDNVIEQIEQTEITTDQLLHWFDDDIEQQWESGRIGGIPIAENEWDRLADDH